LPWFALLFGGILRGIDGIIRRQNLYLAPFGLTAICHGTGHKEKYSFSLLNFSVLDNTIHLIIKPDDGVSLSDLMRWLKTNFAKAWNKRNNTSGHLWGERFQSTIIESEEELGRVMMFIDEKPVEDRLVRRAENWAWGGLWHRARGIAGIVDDAGGLFDGAVWLGRGGG
jgi:putative transposase